MGRSKGMIVEHFKIDRVMIQYKTNGLLRKSVKI